MKSFAIALTCLFPFASFAYDCPTYRLECQLKKINDRGYFQTVKTTSNGFEAFNPDEPSDEPNTCEASVSFGPKDTGLSTGLVAAVKEDLTAYLYVSKDYGALNPQFSLEAVPGKEFKLSNGQQQMLCRIK